MNENKFNEFKKILNDIELKINETKAIKSFVFILDKENKIQRKINIGDTEVIFTYLLNEDEYLNANNKFNGEIVYKCSGNDVINYSYGEEEKQIRYYKSLIKNVDEVRARIENSKKISEEMKKTHKIMDELLEKMNKRDDDLNNMGNLLDKVVTKILAKKESVLDKIKKARDNFTKKIENNNNNKTNKCD